MKGARGLLVDLDGTLWEDGIAYPRAAATLARLRARGLRMVFATNTTSRSRAALARDLVAAGLPIGAAEIWNAPSAGRELLHARGITRAHFLVAEAAREDFGGIAPDDQDPEAVVVGDVAEAFTFERLNRAFRHLLGGAALVALARNRYYRRADALTLDCGPYVAALEEAAGVKAVLAGKPAAAFAGALASLGLPSGDVLVVGDDLEGDVRGPQRLGLRGVLVRTGKYRPGLPDDGGPPPDAVIDSFAEIEELLG